MASIIRHDHMLDVKDEVHADQVQDTFRGSVTSIIDDPFFRNYESPQSAALSKELHTPFYSSDDDLYDDRDAVDKIGYSTKAAWDQEPSQAGLNNINIAVIGAAGVGKSTLIQRSFGLHHHPHSAASNAKIVVDGAIYNVCLIELSLDSFEFKPDRRVEWPKHTNGQIVPRADGALVLYDVMNSDSIIGVPRALDALIFSAFPTILVSCKCDNPVNTHQIGAESIEAACVAEVETVKTASNVPETARHCLGIIIRSITRSRKGCISQDSPLAENGSVSSTISSSSFEDADDDVDLNPHSFLRGFPFPHISGSRTPTRSTKNLGQIVVPAANTAPALSAHPLFRHDMFNSNTAGRHDGEQGINSEVTTHNAANAGKEHDSIIIIDEYDTELSRQYSDDIPILQRTEDFVPDKPKLAGVSFEDLVQRLLREPVTKADVDFSDIFLCLYRKFAAPGELLWMLLRQLDSLNDDENFYPTRTEDQLRLIGVLSKWVTTYPSDFTGEHTRYRVDSLIKRLSCEPSFEAAMRNMETVLQSAVIQDEDSGWARTDADLVSDYERGLPIPCPSAAEEILSWKMASSEESNTATAEEDEDRLQSIERAPSLAMSMASTDATSVSASNSVEDYQVEAATMVPTSTMPLTKFRFQICMDVKDEKLAEEITRIDWVMFSSIRIRDLVRHVSLPLDEKEKYKSLAHVNRTISHFNHIARWVAAMVMMRSKAKHRALMLEKFMMVAFQLRQLNNYNGLAAVIAGINGSPVHRLTQTRALVPENCQKRFMRLELLMSVQKNHFAYRLAWENSSLPRIPFLPLHRQDLVSAEEESRTWVGLNRINWKKFEVQGEALLPIMRSQGTPYPKHERSDIARELILDCKMPTDEEEIHSRSLQLESSSGTSPDHSKKRFPWFSKSV